MSLQYFLVIYWFPLYFKCCMKIISLVFQYCMKIIISLAFQYCTETAVSDKTLYPTFARTKPTDSQISKSVVSLLRMYNWRKVTFIHPYFGNANNTADDIFSVSVYSYFILSSVLKTSWSRKRYLLVAG